MFCRRACLRLIRLYGYYSFLRWYVAYFAKANPDFSRLYGFQLSYANFFRQFSKARPSKAKICEALQNHSYYTLAPIYNPNRLRGLVKRVFPHDYNLRDSVRCRYRKTFPGETREIGSWVSYPEVQQHNSLQHYAWTTSVQNYLRLGNRLTELRERWPLAFQNIHMSDSAGGYGPRTCHFWEARLSFTFSLACLPQLFFISGACYACYTLSWTTQPPLEMTKWEQLAWEEKKTLIISFVHQSVLLSVQKVFGFVCLFVCQSV